MNSSTYKTSLQEFFDIAGHVCWGQLGAVPVDGNTVLPHQELLKVPADVVATDRAPDDSLGVSHDDRSRSFQVTGEGDGLLQEFIQGVGAFAVDCYLAEDGELWFIASTWPDVL